MSAEPIAEARAHTHHSHHHVLPSHSFPLTFIIKAGGNAPWITRSADQAPCHASRSDASGAYNEHPPRIGSLLARAHSLGLVMQNSFLLFAQPTPSWGTRPHCSTALLWAASSHRDRDVKRAATEMIRHTLHPHSLHRNPAPVLNQHPSSWPTRFLAAHR